MMAEGRGIEPLSPKGQPRLSKPARCHSASLPMVREVGLEPTESPRSERGAFANLTTRACDGRHGGSRTHTAQALNLLTLPVGLRAVGAPRWIRTSTNQGLSLTPLPVGLAARSAGRRIRTCTGQGLSLLLLPVERVQRVWRRVKDSNLHATKGVGFRDRGDTNSATTLRSRAYERDSDNERRVERRLIIGGIVTR